jgi:hypothetical protein
MKGEIEQRKIVETFYCFSTVEIVKKIVGSRKNKPEFSPLGIREDILLRSIRRENRSCVLLMSA